MNAPVPKAVLLWDGDCALCRSCAGWPERQDRAGALLALPFQQIPSPPMTPALGARCRRAIQFIPPDGRALSSGRAVLGAGRPRGFVFAGLEKKRRLSIGGAFRFHRGGRLLADRQKPGPHRPLANRKFRKSPLIREADSGIIKPGTAAASKKGEPPERGGAAEKPLATHM
ncbi:MAG: hypothetical protein QF787_13965 [Nitrospinota bacterium]|nr:hypothetical protein [Nitrospinota bacterium]